MQRFHGSLTNGRHIETHVLVWLGNFDQRHAATFAQLSRPRDTGVGTFDGFYRDHGSIFYNDALANIQTAHFFGRRPAETDVLPLRVGRFAIG